MKKVLLIAGLLICATACSKNNETPPVENYFGDLNIIPQPNSIGRLRGQFALTQETEIVARDEPARQAATALNEILQENYGFALVETDQARAENSITFTTVEGVSGVNSDDAYTLRIEPGAIKIKGSARGMFYAVQSLAQLLPAEFPEKVDLPAAEIIDSPRFEYRGMHLDVARHFMPPEFIKKYIGLLARYKFNYFHWHLTDDQGWRVEIKKYPRLTQIGSKRSQTVVASEYKKNNRSNVADGKPVEGFYTQEEIHDIVAFAKAKHVIIIPEIDLPGHSSAALEAHPEYGCKPSYPYKVKTTWGGFPDVFCPTEQSFGFIEDVLGEIIGLFPDSPYLHIGGDEVMPDHWRESGFVQELKRRENLQTEPDVHGWFIRRLENFATLRGKKIIAWDEVVGGGVSTNVTIMSWRDLDKGTQAARAGHKVIIAPYDNTYFDHPQGDEKYEPIAQGKIVTLEDVYKFDPVSRELAPGDAQNIIGAQGCVWTEFIKSPEQVEYMAFPRALALAEVLWSRQRKNFGDFLERLNGEFARLDLKNVNYRIPKPLGLGDRKFSENEKAIIGLTAIPNGKIYFTRDGTIPGTASEVYRASFILDIARDQTIELKVKVVSSNGRESPIYTAVYSRQGNIEVQRNFEPASRNPVIR